MKPIVSLITDAEWVEGVTIARWLEANAPEAYREAVENKVWVPTSPPSPDEDWKDRRYWPVVAQCRKVLVEALEHKEIDLRTLDPPDSSLAQWKSFPDHTQHAIAANWSVGARSGEEYLEHLRSYVFVRVFGRRHRKESPRAAVSWTIKKLEEREATYQAEIAAGKAPRKPLRDDIMGQLMKKNSKLSKTAFRNAWKDVQKKGLIPGIGKEGAPKGPRPSRH